MMGRPKIITQNGLRRYSDWYQLSPTTYDTCCDCGLTHKTQFRAHVDHKTKTVDLFARTKRSVYKTVTQRKKRRVRSSIKSMQRRISAGVS